MARRKKPVGAFCAWREDDEGNWDTECGEKSVVNEGTPDENHMRFCWYCGLKLKVIRYAGDY